MAKIIFVLGELPYPLDKGAKIRTFYLLSSLCERHEVYLFGLKEGQEDKWKIEELKKICKDVIVFERAMKKNGWKFYRDLFLNLFSGRPYIVSRGYSRFMAEEVKRSLKKDKFDVIICDSLQQAPNLLGVNGIPKILNTHNVELVIRKRHCEVERNIFKKAYMYLQLSKLEKYELSALQAFDHILAVSENDKETMAGYRSNPKPRITVIPNGVDCDYCRPVTERSVPDSLIFTGSMDWIPNEDAMLYFLKEIFHLVKQKVPDISLTIVGRNPSSRLQKECARIPSVKLTGYVDDVRPFIAKSSLYIVPLRIGGGTRLKILEAMAMRKPVISTSIGSEGLDVEDKQNIVTADEPQKFAEGIVTLLRNGEEADRIAANGRKLVEERYDWNVVTQKLLSLIEEIC